MKVSEINKAEGEQIHGFARNVVSGLISGKDEFRIPDSPVFTRRNGVALRFLEAGRERNRVAQLESGRPLGPELKRLAIRGAFDDPRRQSITEDQWNRCELEISFLGDSRDVQSFEEIEPGRDGVIIEQNGQSAWCLPGDPVEAGWTREECLTRLCLDAGLEPDAWTRPDCRIRVFQSTVIRP
ncbi:MAG: AMMECR1 family protein [Calditrichaeota bacterium]|nr:AMMECR1 family protein [Candidatus Cloacimonadota bacterium]MCA9785627.1 AMMECR1 family protein [Candidatus Cloacimonadota bacterium]MCB1046954.1 AMMECR1 family protein [Calditrichota bacterium]